MNMHHRTGWGLLLAVGIGLNACARPSTSAPEATADTPKTEAAVATSLPHVLVHKDPMCGCCSLWVDHLRTAGFEVEVRNEANLNPLKQKLGIPPGKGSCHTAEVGGYVIEGHVPADDIRRLLAEKPDARGLTVPGMPAGSPGMEMPNGHVQAYTVELITRDGGTRPFALHGENTP
jgi:hypothetical protein